VRLIVAVVLCAVAVAGCESSQTKSARLAKAPRNSATEKGIEVTTENPAVRVLSTALVHDKYGTAAVVELRSKARAAQAELPLSFTVTGAGGKRLFANDSPGLANTLTHVPLLRAGEHVWWVHDQVQGDAAKRVEAKVGTSKTKLPAKLPRLVPGGLKLEQDPDGAYTSGKLRNDSSVTQLELVVYAVAEKGGRIVAAGRAGIDRLPARRSKLFKVFWIGSPAGARVRLFTPPTVLEEGKR
jgi:hypothetical protein